MQPYLLPYIGYFQLLHNVERFVLYDNIKYTKKGWINRNRMLVNGKAGTFTVPLKHDSDLLDIRERRLAEDFDRRKLLNQIHGAYAKAPQFAAVFALVECSILYGDDNLFAFLHHALVQACAYLGIRTPIVVSSRLAIDHGQRSEAKVLAICRHERATTYINPIGGTELYSASAFAQCGVELRFLRTRLPEYRQFGAPFVPNLFIMDVMMFNPVSVIDGWLASQYDLQCPARTAALASVEQ